MAESLSSFSGVRAKFWQPENKNYCDGETVVTG
jgi:hypothetical protein